MEHGGGGYPEMERWKGPGYWGWGLAVKGYLERGKREEWVVWDGPQAHE